MIVHRMSVHCRALLITALISVATPLAAQTSTGPVVPLPSYPDQTSAYTVAMQPQEMLAATPVPEVPPIEPAQVPRPIVQASFEAPTPTVESSGDRRKLAPPGERRPLPLGPRDRPRDAASLSSNFSLPVDSIYTTATALAVVVGLFLTCAWAVRRGQKKSNNLLPEGVVSVLGRVPLAARQFAELVRVGNKLVLLSVTPNGVEPLTEVTDPVEIDRLLGLCQQRRGNSTTAEFDQVFRQLAQEPAPAGFLGDEVPQVDGHPLPDPFAAYRGGFGRG
jgi:flagellar biogenesis protein FliO